MGRAKLPFKLIDCKKSRKMTLLKRTKGLKKKVSELATLCGVQVCMISFGQNGDPPEIWPEDVTKIFPIIERYQKLNRDVREKNQLHLSDFMKAKMRKLQQELNQKQKENMDIIYPTWYDQLNDYSEERLRNLVGLLDSRLSMVKEKCEEKSAENGKNQAIQTFSDMGFLQANDYMPLPISCIESSSCQFRVSDHTVGLDFPCYPNDHLPFFDMGFPAGMPDYYEINGNLMTSNVQSFRGTIYDAGSSRMGMVENLGFCGEQDMNNMFKNRLIASSPCNMGIGMLENACLSQEKEMFKNTILSNNYDAGFCNVGFSGSNPVPAIQSFWIEDGYQDFSGF